MTSFWGELRRRNVFKVLVAYAIVAWLLIEMTATVFPALKLPDWTVTFVTALILISFPIILLGAWAFEVTPDGIKRTREVPLEHSVTHITGRKFDFAIITLLVLALVFMVVDNYVLRDEPAGVVSDQTEPAIQPVQNSIDDMLTKGSTAMELSSSVDAAGSVADCSVTACVVASTRAASRAVESTSLSYAK